MNENPQEIAQARKIGTYNALDRSRQYQGPGRAEPRELLRAVNEAWTKIRALEKDKLADRLAIAELKADKRRLWKLVLIVASLAGTLASGLMKLIAR